MEDARIIINVNKRKDGNHIFINISRALQQKKKPILSLINTILYRKMPLFINQIRSQII